MKWSKKKVLVTGGAGFLGLSLAKRLCSDASTVTILDNFSSGGRKAVESLPAKIIEGNVTDGASLGRVDDIDYIFHMGSPSSITLFNSNPQVCFRETTEGWLNILNLAKHLGAKKIVFPSSGSVYGRTAPPHTETKRLSPSNLYAVSKLACEHIVEAVEGPPPTTILRVFAGYGPGEDHKGPFASPVTLFLKSIAKNERPVIYGDGNQTRDFVYIDDIVEIAMKSAESTFQGIVNVGSGVSHSFNEVANMINQRLGKKITPRYISKPSHYLEKTLADVSRMKNVFDIDPLPLSEGLDKYCSTII